MDRRGKTEEAVREKKRLTGGAGLAAEERRGRAGRGAGSGWKKRNGPAWPMRERRREERRPEGKGRLGWAKAAGFGLPSFILFPFLLLHSNHSNNLFESK
jgi:hypothetical protein